MKHKMKIGVLFEAPKGLGMGGGYYLQLKNLKILSASLSSEIDLEIISANKISTKNLIKENYKVKNFEYNLITKFFSKLFVIDCIKNFFFRINLNHPFTYFLKKNNYDLIIFLNPSMLAMYCGNKSFIINIWDLDHKKNSQFPEHVDNYTYEKREDFIDKIIHRAFKIVVPYAQVKYDLINYYNVNANNIIVQELIPLLPSIYFSKKSEKIDFLSIFNSFNLPGNKKIIFYPAGYWAHKNHKYIIDCAKHLKQSKNTKFLFVFSGFDMGNYNYIKKLIVKHKLEDYVKSYSFLSEQQIISFYKYCDAVIMPTYGGPTNLPIYESFFFRKPIFYTKNLLKDKKITDTLIEIDILDYKDLILKLELLDNKSLIKEITEKAYKYYQNNCDERIFQKNYQKILEDFNFLISRWKE